MRNETVSRRAILRLLKSLARADAEAVPLHDVSGATVAVSIMRRGGAARDVLHRASQAEWDEAVAVGLLAREPASGNWIVSVEGRAFIVALANHDNGFGRVAPVLSGANGARMAEASRPNRPLENIAESPLAWLRRRRDKSGAQLIDDVQFGAGERLRADFEHGQLSPRVTANWSALGGSGARGTGSRQSTAELRDSVVAARERVGRAFSAVGPELARVLLDVCCHLKGLEQLEKEAGWPQRSAKIILRMALDALARHYGLRATAGVTGAGRIHHWGSDDYRPRMGAYDGR